MAYTPTPYLDLAIQSVSAPGNDYTWRYGSPSDIRRALQRSSSGGGGYSRAAAAQPTKVTTKTVRTGPKPEKPNLPTYESPEYDKRRVSALTQKEAAPGIRRLRESVQEIIGQPEENPNVKRMTLREALRGYGSGLESVMAGAAQAAESKYATELNLQREEAMTNYQAAVNAEMAAYQAAWQDYLSSGERVTETTYGETEGGGKPTLYMRGYAPSWMRNVFNYG